MARAVEDALVAHGPAATNAAYFDTLQHRGRERRRGRQAAAAAGINFRYFADGAIGISVDETTTIRGRRRHRAGVRAGRKRLQGDAPFT
jgi:glycine dehydrogenase